MELLSSIGLIILGGAGGAGLIWLVYQFGGKVPMSALNPFAKKEDPEKDIKIDLVDDAKEKPSEDNGASILKQKGDELKKKLKLLVLLGLGSGILFSQPNGTYALPASDGLIDNYVETTYEYAVKNGEEFNSLRQDTRKDTKIVDVEKTSHSRTVKIVIPLKEPVIKEDPVSKFMRIEFNDKNPIIRTVKVSCSDSGPSISQIGSRFWFGPALGLMASVNSFSKVDPQAGVFLDLLHWSNEYMRISLGGFAGYRRYGASMSVGPAMNLSNIRLVVGYARDYGNTEQSIEVGVGSLLYLN